MEYKFDKKVPYRTCLSEYVDKWSDFAYLRREDGILEIRFHWEDGPLKWNEAVHGAMIPLLADISHDPENECIIVTGTGDSFLNTFDKETNNNPRKYESSITYDWWYSVQTRHPSAWIDIPVPVISAVNGPCTIHPETVLLADYIIVADTTYIPDRHFADAGAAPTDGVNILYDQLFGTNRARALLWTGKNITADDGLQLGLFSEVVPLDKVLERAWQFARETIMPVPRIHRRMAREVFIQPFREAFAKGIRGSLVHECYASEVNKELLHPEDSHKNLYTER